MSEAQAGVPVDRLAPITDVRPQPVAGERVYVDTGSSIVKTQPLPGRFRTVMSPPKTFTALRLTFRPRPSPVRSWPRRAPKRVKNASELPSGSPPHSSSTSIETTAFVQAVRTVT